MRNICTVNLANMEACGVLTSATGTNELILEIVPLITQIDGFKIEITKAAGGVVTENAECKFNVIRYAVPFSYFSSAGTMKVRLLSNQGNSGYINFTIAKSLSESGNVKVQFDPDNLSFSISEAVNQNDTGWIEIIGTELAVNIKDPSAGTPVKCRKKNGIVYVTGTFGIVNAPSSSNYTLFTFPEECLPDFNGYYYVTNTATGARMSRYLVNAAGVNLEWVRSIIDGSITTGEISWSGIDFSFPAKT